MTMTARFLPQYPKRIQVTDGLTKTEANGVLTLGFDYVNSEFGAELQQAVDTTAANASATAADRVQTGLDVIAANDAAGIATSAVSIFKTKTAAESAHPIAAYDYIKTWGRSNLADAGDVLAKNNGTTSGDLVLTLDDGFTEVGYDIQRSLEGYRPQQFAVIGNVDDRTAFQAALDKMQDGDTLVFPGWATATIINGVGSGADIVAKRADAVANGGLKALTCDKNNIRIVIDGHVKATSALDDLFRFTGDNVQVTGRGLLENTSGVWLDTNSPDITLQWRPSIIYFAGDDSGVDGRGALRFLNPCQTGVRLGGNRNYSFHVRYIGGPPSYRPNGGLGTAMFAVFSGSGFEDVLTVDNKVMGNWFIPNATGGRMYQSIFGTNARATYADNHHEGAWELGIYNYGADVKIHSEQMNGVEAAIQNVATGGSIRDCRITANTGGILSLVSSFLQVTDNVIRANNGGIALRRSIETPQTNVDRDIIIANNLVDLFGDVSTQQSPIDVFLDNSVVGLNIIGNQVVGGGGGENVYAGIRVIGYASAQALDVNVTNNSLRNANGVAIHVQSCINPQVVRNKILNSNNNAGEGDAAITMGGVTGAFVSKNTVRDLRDTPLTKRILTALEDDSNSGVRAVKNVGINLDPAETSLVTVPTDSSSEAIGNSRNNAPTRGKFFVSDAISAGVTAPGVMANAKVVLTPANPNADVLQQSSKRIYVNSVSNGSFGWITADNTATGSTAAEYLWEAIQ